MHVCVRLYIYIWTRVYLYMYMRTYVHTYKSIHTHKYAHTHTHAYMDIRRARWYVWMCMYVCTIYTDYTWKHTHIYIDYTWVHTHTHTCAHAHIHKYKYGYWSSKIALYPRTCMYTYVSNSHLSSLLCKHVCAYFCTMNTYSYIHSKQWTRIHTYIVNNEHIFIHTLVNNEHTFMHT